MGTLQESLTLALQHPPPGMEDLQLLPDNPRLAPLQPLLRALRVQPDGLLLVVCPRARELDVAVLDAPRVVVWSEPETRHARQRMPASVVAVVFTSLPGHRGTAHVQHQARQIGAQCHHTTITPRTVLDLCTHAGLIPITHTDAATMPTTHTAPQTTRTPPRQPRANPHVDTKTGKTRQGVLATFLRDQATLWPEKPHTTTLEIARLTDLAATLNIPTTRGSIAEAFYTMRRAQRAADGQPPSAQSAAAAGKPRTSKRLPTKLEPPPQTTPPAAAAAPPPATSTAPAPQSTTPADAEKLDRDLVAMEAMLDDALTGLALIRDGLAVLRPQIARLFASASEMTSLRAKLTRIELALTGEQNA